MNVDELAHLLTDYGLTEQEARAYYHLCKRGEATASDLAKAASLSRGDTYRAADGLEQHGLLQRTMDRPQRFLPLAIEDAIDRLLDRERHRVDKLSGQRDTLVSHWPRTGTGESEDEMRFHVRQGRAMIEGELRRMIERATREVALAAPHRTVNRLLTWGLGPVLGEAAARGVRVRILTQLTEDLIGQDSGIPDDCERRHSEVPVYAQFLIVDQREIASYVSADPVVGTTGRPETVLWLNSPDYALGQQALFDDLWDESLDEATRATELETGHVPMVLLAVNGRLPRLDRVRQVMSDTERHLRLVVDDALAAAAKRLDLGRVVDRLLERGATVQILVQGPISGLENRDGLELRQGSVRGEVTMCVRDDVQGLVGLLPDDQEARHERAVLFTVPRAVAMASAAFDEAWAKARPLTVEG